MRRIAKAPRKAFLAIVPSSASLFCGRRGYCSKSNDQNNDSNHQNKTLTNNDEQQNKTPLSDDFFSPVAPKGPDSDLKGVQTDDTPLPDRLHSNEVLDAPKFIPSEIPEDREYYSDFHGPAIDKRVRDAMKNHQEENTGIPWETGVPLGTENANTDQLNRARSDTLAFRMANRPKWDRKKAREEGKQAAEEAEARDAAREAAEKAAASSGGGMWFGGGGGGAGSKTATAGEEGAEAEKPKYAKSTDFFGRRTVTLTQSFSGSSKERELTYQENIYYAIRYWFTRERFVGKDRYGNIFMQRWYFYRTRHEERRCYRKDLNKRHQPYGALPTDSRLWEAWMRAWRHNPPTVEEEEVFREKKREKMGPHILGDESHEDAMVRAWAHTTHAAPFLQELDVNEQYNQFIDAVEHRYKDRNDNNPNKSSWTAGFTRGDLLYNEQQTQTMRDSHKQNWDDQVWQLAEMQRQTQRNRSMHKGAGGHNFPRSKEGLSDQKKWQDEASPSCAGDPMDYRTDLGIPFDMGVSGISSPMNEKLKMETAQMEDERLRLRKELGLTDLSDIREGRAPIQKSGNFYDNDPVTKDWQPKVWFESWEQ